MARSRLVVRKQRVKSCGKVDPSGQIVMSIKFGAKPIEFEKGKAGMWAPSKDKLPTVITPDRGRSSRASWTTCLPSASKQRPAHSRKGATEPHSDRVGFGLPGF